MDEQTYETIRKLPWKEQRARVEAFSADERDEFFRIGKEIVAKSRAQKLKTMKPLLTRGSKWVLNCLYSRNYVVEVIEVHRTKVTVALETGSNYTNRKCDIIELRSIEEVEAADEKIYDFTRS